MSELSDTVPFFLTQFPTSFLENNSTTLFKSGSSRIVVGSENLSKKGQNTSLKELIKIYKLREITIITRLRIR